MPNLPALLILVAVAVLVALTGAELATPARNRYDRDPGDAAGRSTR